MPTITIPKDMLKENDLIIMPRKKYEEFLDLERELNKRINEEDDTDLAVKIYKKEKGGGKLKTIRSLADFD